MRRLMPFDGRQGIVPLSWSLDHAGPIVRSVEDAALVLGVIAGHDRRDPQSLAADVHGYANRPAEHVDQGAAHHAASGRGCRPRE